MENSIEFERVPIGKRKKEKTKDVHQFCCYWSFFISCVVLFPSNQ